MKNIINKLLEKKQKRFPRLYKDDIFLVSYPKSGNTWVRFILANYLTNNNCDFINSHLIIPDIHFNPEELRNITIRPRFIKSHNNYTSRYKRVIYIVRDGRDVAVSYYFHLIKYYQINPDTSFKDYLQEFNAGHLNNYGSWSSHVKSWTRNKAKDFLLIKYEDLKSNTYREVSKILDFSGLEIVPIKLQESIRASSFENMKIMENLQNNFTELLSNSNQNISFVRKGLVGDWKNMFQEEDTKLFKKNHADVLKSFNYQE